MEMNANYAFAEGLAKLDVALAVLKKKSVDLHDVMDREDASWGDVATVNHLNQLLNAAFESITGYYM